jgi:hypothetical protein
MEVKNLVGLYFGDVFHPKIGEFSFRMLYFFLHVPELYSNLLFCFLLMKVQKNLPAVDGRVRLQS